jgi:ribosomal protein L37E
MIENYEILLKNSKTYYVCNRCKRMEESLKLYCAHCGTKLKAKFFNAGV